jgi:hypothetical protein
LSSGVFRNKDYVPFLFVNKIVLASRQYFAVLSPTHRKMGDAQNGLNPQRLNSKQILRSEHRNNHNRNILKGVA